MGGLGVRLASELAETCYISSIAASKSLVCAILGQATSFDECSSRIIDEFSTSNDLSHDMVPLDSQKKIDRLLCERKFDNLVVQASSCEERAILLSSRQPLSRSWLEVLPNANTGTLLSNTVFRVGVGLRLGADICREHCCIDCVHPVSAKGHHGLRCQFSRGRASRHSAINEEIYRSLVAVQIPARREPSGLLPDPMLRPDGITLVPWNLGKYAAWDATVCDTLAVSYLPATCRTPGKGADKVEAAKRLKYRNLDASFSFFPSGLETLGGMGSGAKTFLEDLRLRLQAVSGDSMAGVYFYQRLALAIVRSNVACVLGTMIQRDGFLEAELDPLIPT
jgi:hypothetical protein